MSGKRRNPQPLTSVRLEELAVAYVARFATTQAKLRAYLLRKLRERGWDEEEADAAEGRIEAIVAQHAAAGFVDDAAWAGMKAGSLLRRGYGGRRIGAALGQAGISAELRAGLQPEPAALRRAALVLARRRRFGPYAVQPPDRPAREKQIAAMLRAGHALDIARRIVEADAVEAIEAWADSDAPED